MVAYPDLGCEAIHRLEVKDLPVVVINDCHGGDFYRESRAKYARSSAPKNLPKNFLI